MSRGQTVILRGPSQRDHAKKLVDLAPADAVVNIREATRTSAQNDKMWAMLSDISRAKPEGRNLPSDRWKCLFMDQVGHKPVWEPGLDGGVVNVGYKSSRLTVAEMSEMIEAIYAYGAQHGVAWSQ
jgi:hypothetical protein